MFFLTFAKINNLKKLANLEILPWKTNIVNIVDVQERTYASDASFETKEYLLHKLEEGPSRNVTMNKEEGVNFYKDMVMIRKFEQATVPLYQTKIIRGFLHLYCGQEACAVGMKAAMRPEDAIVGGYRIHAVAYMMGINEKQILAELCGKQTGSQRGKGGSMHLYGKSFYGGHGIVGAQFPIGTGIALAAKYKGTGGVCFTLFGDGAANQGQAFESYNMAMLWKLPVVYVCENNGYAMGTSIERGSACIRMYKRGHYVPGLWVDGMDVLAVREATKFCIDYCTAGKGPLVMELATYRYYGHSMSDPGTGYRTREETQEVRKTQDPITQLKERLVGNNLATEEELKAIDAEAKKKVDTAVEESKADPELPVSEIPTDVSVNELVPIRNNLPFNPLPHKRVGKAFNEK